MQRIREKDEIKQRKSQEKMMRLDKNKVIVEQIMRRLPMWSKHFLQFVERENLEEVNRRISALTKPCISEALYKLTYALHKLNINVSSATLLEKLRSILVMVAVIIPEYGISKCVVARKLAAGFIFKTITQIKNERVRKIKNILKERDIRASIISFDEKSRYGRRVSLENSSQIIGESSFSYDEFIGDLKKVSEERAEKSV